jgi:hypothetical protein
MHYKFIGLPEKVNKTIFINKNCVIFIKIVHCFYQSAVFKKTFLSIKTHFLIHIHLIVLFNCNTFSVAPSLINDNLKKRAVPLTINKMSPNVIRSSGFQPKRRHGTQHNGSQHNDTHHKRHSALMTLNIKTLFYAECCVLFIIMLSVITLNVVMLSVVMLNVMAPPSSSLIHTLS